MNNFRGWNDIDGQMLALASVFVSGRVRVRDSVRVRGEITTRASVVTGR